MPRLTRSPWLVAGALLALSLVLMAPALVSEHMLSGDTHIHLRWQAFFAETVADGTWFPRWLPRLNHGFGSPVFFIYPTLVQWVGTAFWPLLPGTGWSMERLALALAVVSAIGAFGAWRWLREMGLGGSAAALGALCFLFAPYRSYFDIYQRGAPAELTGISAIPWLLACAHGIKARRPEAWGGFALATAAILYSHLPAAEMGLLFAAGYVLALAERRDWRGFFWRIGSATVVGILIAGPLLGTALTLLGNIGDDTNLFGALHQPNNWLFFGPAWDDRGIQLVAGVIALLSLVLVAVLLPAALADGARRRIVWYLGLSVIVILLLNTIVAGPFWALHTPLSRIQFPFRLLSLAVVALAGLAAIGFEAAAVRGGPRGRLLRSALLAVAPAMLLADSGLLTVHRLHNRGDLPPDTAAILAETRDTEEYVLGSLEQLGARYRKGSAIVLAGAATVRPVAWHSRAIAFEVAADKPALIAPRQFAFTGWRCRIDGGAWVPAGLVPPPLNVPGCEVPTGVHRLEMDMPARAGERIGGWAALAGLAIALGAMLYGGLMRGTPGRSVRS